MPFVDRHSVRSKILHALVTRPFLTTKEVVAAVGLVPWVSASTLISDCDVCGTHFDHGQAEVRMISIRVDASGLLNQLAKEGKITKYKVPGVQQNMWSLVREAHGPEKQGVVSQVDGAES